MNIIVKLQSIEYPILEPLKLMWTKNNMMHKSIVTAECRFEF